MPDLSPFEQDQQRAIAPTRHRAALAVARVFWVIALIGASLGGFIAFVGIAQANGAPQEAAAAAIGCLVAIVPYVFARAVDELSRP